MMDWLYSLRTRLIVLYTGLILLGFGGLAFWAGQQIETAAEEDFEHRVESEVAIVARGLSEPVEHYLEGESTEATVAGILDNYARETGSRLSLINNRGVAWLSTYEPPADLIYLSLPEIITARQNRITHETRRDHNNEWMVYTAAPITEDGRVISLVQLIVPLDNVQSSVRQRWVALGLGIGGLGVLVLLMSILISASLTRPLARLRMAAVRISQGDFSAHVPDTRRDEIGQVAQTFNQMAGRLQTMLDEQRAFSSNVSHELRTPITAIQLRVDALLDGQLPPQKQTRYLEEVGAEIGRMNNLVDDLILLSRLDSGSLEIGRDQVDLPRFARQLIREMETEGVTITLTANESLPPLAANLTHLHVVFRNILDNAIKYGGTQIAWEMRLADGKIVSTITDNGRGIASEELDAVLQRFYRADKARSRAIPGAGLGLSLVQSIVSAYGGSFSLRSGGIGQGTTVEVSWQSESGMTIP